MKNANRDFFKDFCCPDVKIERVALSYITFTSRLSSAIFFLNLRLSVRQSASTLSRNSTRVLILASLRARLENLYRI